MSINQVVAILKKYGVNVNLTAELIQNSAWDIYSEINRRNLSLSEQEHITLFDALWELGNRSRGKNIQISQQLKLKLIRDVGRMPYFHFLATGDLRGSDIIEILRDINMTSGEEAELWWIYSQLDKNEAEVTRDCDQINDRLGLYKVIESKLKWFGKIRILDIGCGKRGIGISTLVARYQNKIGGYGVDIAIAEHPSNVKIVRGDFRNLPFRNNFFDIIYSSNVIYYIKDKEIVPVMKEILRVLKPRGMFVFDEQNRSLSTYKNNIIPRIDTKVKILKGYTSASFLIIKY